MRWLATGLMFLNMQVFAQNAKDGLKKIKSGKEVKTKESVEVKKIDTAKSEIIWKGKHVSDMIGGGHQGNVKIKSGEVKMDKNTITGGELIVDLTTINDQDLTDADKKGKLEGHLKSPDFFDVAKYPTAKLVLLPSPLAVGGTTNFKGKLTIRDKTENVVVPLTVTTVNGVSTAKGELKINRIKFGVKYASQSLDIKLLKDKAIDDEIILDLNIVTAS